jgi:hypothetical protein
MGVSATWSSSIGKQMARKEQLRFEEGLNSPPEVHYFSCAGTRTSLSYAFESQGICTFYPSGCQSTGSLSVAIARSVGGEVLIGQSQCITGKIDPVNICCLFAASVTIFV